MVNCLTSKEYRTKREQKLQCGELNSEKIFYVLRTESPDSGIYTLSRAFLIHIKYAIDKGYIPVIDLKNYYVVMLQNSRDKYKENAWEYYYEQPVTGVSLDEVYKSKNVVLASMNELPEVEQLDWKTWNTGLTKSEILCWNIYAKQYLRLKKEIQQAVEEEYEKLFPKGKRILGVSIRRNFEWGRQTDPKKYQAHPIQADLEEYMKDIDNCLKKWNCDYIFLSIDDRETCNIFEKRYGYKCILMERNRRHMFKNNTPNLEQAVYFCEFELDEKGEIAHLKEENISYIKEIYLLIKCECLLASLSGGIHFALVMNGGKYEHTKIYQKGII